jgi:hypothetical protein
MKPAHSKKSFCHSHRNSITYLTLYARVLIPPPFTTHFLLLYRILTSPISDTHFSFIKYSFSIQHHAVHMVCRDGSYGSKIYRE